MRQDPSFPEGDEGEILVSYDAEHSGWPTTTRGAKEKFTPSIPERTIGWGVASEGKDR